MLKGYVQYQFQPCYLVYRTLNEKDKPFSLKISILFIVLSDRKFELTLMTFKQLYWKCTHSVLPSIVLDNLFGEIYLTRGIVFSNDSFNMRIRIRIQEAKILRI